MVAAFGEAFVAINTQQRGVALVLVLWSIALLSLMAASFGLGVRREAMLTSNLAQSARLEAAAEAAIHYAAFMLSQSDPQFKWRTEGAVYEIQWEQIPVRIQLLDETGKVDLNRANEQLLQAVLQGIGIETEQAVALSDAILDWRDRDNLRRVNGAEEDEYRAEGLSYVPPNKPFQSIEEVALVLGMKPQWFKKLLPLVTVHGKRPGINPAKAPEALLKALPGMDPAMVETYIQARSAVALTGEAPPPLPAPQGIRFHRSKGNAIGVTVQAKSGNSIASYQTVIQLNRGSGKRSPFNYLEWRQAPPPKSLFEYEEVISAEAQTEG